MTIQVAYNLIVRKTVYSTQIWPKLRLLESADLCPHWVNVQYCPLLQVAEEFTFCLLQHLYMCVSAMHMLCVYCVFFRVRFPSSKSKVIC